jgi:hypothetical protein
MFKLPKLGQIDPKILIIAGLVLAILGVFLAQHT